MTAVAWRNFRSNDLAQPLSLEEIFRRYGAWSGIHDFSFDSTFTLNTLTVTGIASDDYTIHMLGVALPANCTIRYHKTDARQGLVISAGEGALFLIVGTDSSGYPKLMLDSDSPAQFIPKTTPVEADVEVVVRQQTFDDVSGIVWRSFTIYMNGKWITTYSNFLSAAYSDIDVGFFAFDTDEVTYTNIQIPELGDTAEFGTTDPGEYALGGLQRTLEGRYLHYFVRYDGSLRAWKKKARDRVLTLTNMTGISRVFDLPQLITHARMMGAYIWAESVDQDNLRLYGQRFQEVNNSMLLTPTENQEEAANSLKRSEESAFGLSAQSRHIPILEPEDRVQIDGEDWIINDYTLTFAPSQITEVYHCRKYVWGS